LLVVAFFAAPERPPDLLEADFLLPEANVLAAADLLPPVDDFAELLLDFDVAITFSFK
jgi:hypothetical protein